MKELQEMEISTTKTGRNTVAEFEREFTKASTITSLQQFLKQLGLKRIKLLDEGTPQKNSLLVLDAQIDLVNDELTRLRRAQKKGRFRAFYAFLGILDEHYPYKTPVIRYRYLLDDGVSGVKDEMLSNMLHLLPVERKPYLDRVRHEMEKLLENVFAKEETIEEWCSKYGTSEKEIFAPAASGHRNKVYEALSAERIGLSGGDSYAIVNDFYNVFYGRAVKDVLNMAMELIGEYGSTPELLEKKEKSPDDRASVTVQCFEDLFYDKSAVDTCLDLLRKAEPRVIDDENQFSLGVRCKAAIVAWVDALKAQSMMRKNISNKETAVLLNQKIRKLNITDRTLRSAQTKVSAIYEKYQKQF